MGAPGLGRGRSSRLLHGQSLLMKMVEPTGLVRPALALEATRSRVRHGGVSPGFGGAQPAPGEVKGIP